MPHNFDFSKVKNLKTLEVNPNGWISPLIIEYGIVDGDGDQINNVISYYWRVKGTLHTFVIPVIRMDYLSSGNYKKHFEDALEKFREDYISWKEQGINAGWVNEYYSQYSRFIII